MTLSSNGLVLTGRIILGVFFVLAGISKLTSPDAAIAMMAGQNFPAPNMLLWPVILLEIGGGALLIWGRKYIFPIALILAAFTLATNLAFHRFWEIEDPLINRLELSLFFKNLAIMGGLFLIAGIRDMKAVDPARSY